MLQNTLGDTGRLESNVLSTISRPTKARASFRVLFGSPGHSLLQPLFTLALLTLQPLATTQEPVNGIYSQSTRLSPDLHQLLAH